MQTRVQHNNFFETNIYFSVLLSKNSVLYAENSVIVVAQLRNTENPTETPSFLASSSRYVRNPVSTASGTLAQSTP